MFQCSKPCHRETYDNEKVIREMVLSQGFEIVHGEDAGWHTAAERYQTFMKKHRGEKVVFLELGVGYNTPGIIKYNFWQYACQWQQAFYVCINKGQAAAFRIIL